MKLREADEIKVGDCFFNVRRNAMLRIKHISGEDARYVSWRPDGTRGSQIGRVKLKNLTRLPYFRAAAIQVYSIDYSLNWSFGLIPECADRKPQEAGYLG